MKDVRAHVQVSVIILNRLFRDKIQAPAAAAAAAAAAASALAAIDREKAENQFCFFRPISEVL